MQKTTNSQSGLFNLRVLLAFSLCSVGGFLPTLDSAAMSPSGVTQAYARQMSSPSEWTQFSATSVRRQSGAALP